MGIFGAIYTTFVLGAKACQEIKNSVEDNNNRNKAIKKGKEIYIGSDNSTRYVKDGKRVTYCRQYLNGYNNKPDLVLKYVGTDTIIRNISQENRTRTEKESYQEAIKKGYTVYRIGEKYDNHFNDKCRGLRYKDIKTGDIYVIRCVRGSNFYMNVETSLLVRKTDGQIKREKEVAESVKNNEEKYRILHEMFLKHDEENLMEQFNQKQIKYEGQYGRNYRNDLVATE